MIYYSMENYTNHNIIHILCYVVYIMLHYIILYYIMSYFHA